MSTSNSKKNCSMATQSANLVPKARRETVLEQRRHFDISLALRSRKTKTSEKENLVPQNLQKSTATSNSQKHSKASIPARQNQVLIHTQKNAAEINPSKQSKINRFVRFDHVPPYSSINPLNQKKRDNLVGSDPATFQSPRVASAINPFKYNTANSSEKSGHVALHSGNTASAINTSIQNRTHKSVRSNHVPLNSEKNIAATANTLQQHEPNSSVRADHASLHSEKNIATTNTLRQHQPNSSVRADHASLHSEKNIAATANTLQQHKPNSSVRADHASLHSEKNIATANTLQQHKSNSSVRADHASLHLQRLTTATTKPLSKPHTSNSVGSTQMPFNPPKIASTTNPLKQYETNNSLKSDDGLFHSPDFAAVVNTLKQRKMTRPVGSADVPFQSPGIYVVMNPLKPNTMRRSARSADMSFDTPGIYAVMKPLRRNRSTRSINVPFQSPGVAAVIKRGKVFNCNIVKKLFQTQCSTNIQNSCISNINRGRESKKRKSTKKNHALKNGDRQRSPKTFVSFKDRELYDSKSIGCSPKSPLSKLLRLSERIMEKNMDKCRPGSKPCSKSTKLDTLSSVNSTEVGKEIKNATSLNVLEGNGKLQNMKPEEESYNNQAFDSFETHIVLQSEQNRQEKLSFDRKKKKLCVPQKKEFHPKVWGKILSLNREPVSCKFFSYSLDSGRTILSKPPNRRFYEAFNRGRFLVSNELLASCEAIKVQKTVIGVNSKILDEVPHMSAVVHFAPVGNVDDEQKDVGDRKQAVESRQQDVGGRQQDVGGRQQDVGGRQQDAGSRQQDVGDSQQDADDSQKDVDDASSTIFSKNPLYKSSLIHDEDNIYESLSNLSIASGYLPMGGNASSAELSCSEQQDHSVDEDKSKVTLHDYNPELMFQNADVAPSLNAPVSQELSQVDQEAAIERDTSINEASNSGASSRFGKCTREVWYWLEGREVPIAALFAVLWLWLMALMLFLSLGDRRVVAILGDLGFHLWGGLFCVWVVVAVLLFSIEVKKRLNLEMEKSLKMHSEWLV